MMDVVALAMLAVLPVLTLSLWLVRKRHRYALHKRLQIGTASVLGVAILLFEIDIRLHDWRPLAKASPFYDTWLFPLLYVHLVFAVSTTLLWIATLITALRDFPVPPCPGPGSTRHRRLGRLAAFGMYATSVTGWSFYWAAFLA
jgi:uncharacterized membrane protein YozB (DUF420 family)